MRVVAAWPVYELQELFLSPNPVKLSATFILRIRKYYPQDDDVDNVVNC